MKGSSKESTVKPTGKPFENILWQLIYGKEEKKKYVRV